MAKTQDISETTPKPDAGSRSVDPVKSPRETGSDSVGAGSAKPQAGAVLPAPSPRGSSAVLVSVPLPANPRKGAAIDEGLHRTPARPMAASTTEPATADAAKAPVTAVQPAAPSNKPATPAATPAPVTAPAAVPTPAAAPAAPGKAAGQAQQGVEPGKPIAAAAQMRGRHRGVLASFVALVLLPVVVAATYLWVLAIDQYASTVGFSVRTERVSSALDILGGITRLSGGGSSDSDILYDYIHSQELVAELDEEIDLSRIYSKAWPVDPIFAFDPTGSVEDLLDHWKDNVRITYDSSSSLMTLRVLAFTPQDATLIASKILEHSTDKINVLAAESHEDATRYARAEMERALERLKIAREAMTGFRMRTQMVDPIADLQGQMGILNSFQAQLAQSYVELDLLRGTTSAGDPRIVQAEQRIIVIRNRMEEERLKFSESGKGPGGEDYATMVAEFERLTVDREFAEQAYRIALAAYDAAQAEAQRKSRYLAAHIQPTAAEKSEFPQRWTLLGLIGFFLLMSWAIAVLIFYSIRDRR